jgi:hypothetical protein
MTLGWIITKSHSSGLTEVYARDYKESCLGYFTPKISESYIFRSKTAALDEFKHYSESNSETYELVPVEAYI